ncbi:DUF4362 domain-containing protein [Saccharibacillus sacchari]|uniref:DUF4362 domain-containing protein n=1 Tax=Saccharibacillus sacchari TaxID=456493 RepID=UPI000559ED9A|nr:DUF4362 domain-containing protein [Saccharibacillus sacchari]
MKSRVRSVASLMVILLSGCSTSKPYNFEAAAERGDIVDVHGQVSNAQRLEEFNQNFLQNVKDKIRITRSTIEGDPTFYDIQFNGKEIKLKYDNSKDKHGRSIRQSTVCESLIARETQRGIEYSFDECSGKNKDLGNTFKLEVSNGLEVKK